MPEAGAPPPATGGPALAALADLPVKGRAPKTGYDRRKFGSPWADTDGNDCGTRDDVLARDLDDVTVEPDACTVTSGTLTTDPYTGRTLTFERGRSTIDIDHVVALSDAWQKGAHTWDPAKRIAFANDPLNLLAVDAGANRQKGDADAATWLPPHTPHRCAYAASQVAVKEKYGLWVTRAEKDALARVLNPCPGTPLPAGDAPTKAPPAFSAPR
ncbi:HNH endonuclease family protein [Streptomyces sp. TRM 70351]|nr:HNH endonuclease family protein [Streptomyces sp. TRM 70351]MEE1930534.1 HNH endonuclease family protein [Streptomyces sp. TRM 70351]